MVQIDGVQHNLGADREQAFQRYHDLMREPVPQKQVASESVVGVIDKYLDWCQEHRAAETFEWYRWWLQLFVESIDKSLTVCDLKHYHLDDWLSKCPVWSGGTKHGMTRILHGQVGIVVANWRRQATVQCLPAVQSNPVRCLKLTGL